MRPSLVISTLLPRETKLDILVDNSSSMGLPLGNNPRGEPVRKLLQPDAEFLAALEEKFRVRLIRFDSRVSELDAEGGTGLEREPYRHRREPSKAPWRKPRVSPWEGSFFSLTGRTTFFQLLQGGALRGENAKDSHPHHRSGTRRSYP